MFNSFASTTLSRSCPQQCRSQVFRRSFQVSSISRQIIQEPSGVSESSSATSASEPDSSTVKEKKADNEADQDQTLFAGRITTLKQFLSSPMIRSMKETKKPRNWLGGARPFPMNPSFVPPSPISDALRSQIYGEFMQDPLANNLRVLSERYHLSLKRLDAILRLKAQEEDWKKSGKQLQTAYQSGMEHLLGVEEDAAFRNERKRYNSASSSDYDPTRRDVSEADALEQEENRDFARQRYQHMYWESVPEDGREPVTPAGLELAKATAKSRVAAAIAQKTSHPLLMPNVRPTPGIKSSTPAVQRAEKDGRPPIVFVDVGGKFIDVNERLKRVAEGERRNKRKAQKKAQDRVI